MPNYLVEILKCDNPSTGYATVVSYGTVHLSTLCEMKLGFFSSVST